MSETKLCFWCHEPLPPLPEDASYVDEINHYVHDECRDERDDNNRRMEQLRAGPSIERGHRCAHSTGSLGAFAPKCV